MICPKCGEDNSENFRFCGMCGTLLEARVESRRPAGAPVPNLPPVQNLPPNLPKITHPPESPRPPVVEHAANAANEQVPRVRQVSQVPWISGPSLLGLDQPGASQPALNQRSPNQRGPNEPGHDSPSRDSLRENSFSGSDSFFEPEQPKTGGRRVFLLMVLLAALGAAGWWTYANYLGSTYNRKPEAATSSAGETPAEKPTTKPSPKPSTKSEASNAAAAPDAGSSQIPAPSAAVPEGPSENANASPNASPKNADAEAKTATKATPVAPRAAPREKIAEKREAEKRELAKRESEKRGPRVTAAKAAKLPEPATADTGAADFRRAEAYLYGRGVRENCDEAVKYLKAASAKSNAKARSAFGTMYATGHCVARDLPTSYLWFALALRLDPNNQILEKDLGAVWNQMTPPERQMATRAKQ